MRELYRWSSQWWPGAIALVILWAFAAWTSTEPLEGDLAARSNAAVRDAVLDKKRVLPCAAWLKGEFGLTDVYCGVPCKLGRSGLEGIIEVTLTAGERRDLHQSAEAVRAIQAMV